MYAAVTCNWVQAQSFKTFKIFQISQSQKVCPKIPRQLFLFVVAMIIKITCIKYGITVFKMIILQMLKAIVTIAVVSYAYKVHCTIIYNNGVYIWSMNR